MSIIQILLPISILLAGSFALAFILAVRSGQYDDVDTPPRRILFDAPKIDAHKTSAEEINLNDKNENNVVPDYGSTPGQSTGETT